MDETERDSFDDQVTGTPLEQSLTRRAFFGVGAGVVAGLMTRKINTTEAVALDYCYWKRVQGPICSNGRKLEYRCEICCAGGVCETVRCVWVDLGPC